VSAPRFCDLWESDAWIVALESAGDDGTVALARGGALVEEARIAEPRRQAARLLPTLMELLEGQGVGADQVQGLVVGEGPGSFTGVRVAAATAKGWLFATDVPLWTPSSLEGAALGGSAEEWGSGQGVRTAAFDARGDRLYAATYEIVDRPSLGQGGVSEEVADGRVVRRAPWAGTIDELLAQGPEALGVVAGTASARHRARLLNAGIDVAEPPAGQPSARGLLQALALDPARRAHENARTWEPAYLRPSGATPPPTTRKAP